MKKGSLFMKLARKQFDYKFRLPAPRYAPDVLHETPHGVHAVMTMRYLMIMSMLVMMRGTRNLAATPVNTSGS